MVLESVGELVMHFQYIVTRPSNGVEWKLLQHETS